MTANLKFVFDPLSENLQNLEIDWLFDVSLHWIEFLAAISNFNCQKDIGISFDMNFTVWTETFFVWSHNENWFCINKIRREEIHCPLNMKFIIIRNKFDSIDTKFMDDISFILIQEICKFAWYALILFISVRFSVCVVCNLYHFKIVQLYVYARACVCVCVLHANDLDSVKYF